MSRKNKSKKVNYNFYGRAQGEGKTKYLVEDLIKKLQKSNSPQLLFFEKGEIRPCTDYELRQRERERIKYLRENFIKNCRFNLFGLDKSLPRKDGTVETKVDTKAKSEPRFKEKDVVYVWDYSLGSDSDGKNHVGAIVLDVMDDSYNVLIIHSQRIKNYKNYDVKTKEEVMHAIMQRWDYIYPQNLIESLYQKYKKKTEPKFKVGDVVDIIEDHVSFTTRIGSYIINKITKRDGGFFYQFQDEPFRIMPESKLIKHLSNGDEIKRIYFNELSDLDKKNPNWFNEVREVCKKSHPETFDKAPDWLKKADWKEGEKMVDTFNADCIVRRMKEDIEYKKSLLSKEHVSRMAYPDLYILGLNSEISLLEGYFFWIKSNPCDEKCTPKSECKSCEDKDKKIQELEKNSNESIDRINYWRNHYLDKSKNPLTEAQLSNIGKTVIELSNKITFLENQNTGLKNLLERTRGY